MKALGISKKGLLFVVSAPAGTGKTTLVKMLLDEFACVTKSISYTTRAIRKEEKADVDYHFASKEEFEEMIRQEKFLEYAKVFDDYYGTSKKFVEDAQNQGKHVILVIDTQGAMQLKGKIDAVFIFICPPTMEVLSERLESRATESSAIRKKRLSWAKKEMEVSKSYDYRIVNDDLKTAYQVLRSILIAEEHKVRNNP